MKKRFKPTITFVLVVLSIAMLYSCYWVMRNYSGVTLQQLVFHANINLNAANMDVFYKFLIEMVVVIVLSIIAIWVLHFLIVKLRKAKKLDFAIKISLKAASITTILVFTFTIAVIANEIKAVDYFVNVNNPTVLYEGYYRDPTETKITFPEKKRNLIHLVLESMETSFMDYNNNGESVNLIPNLTKLMEDNFTVSKTGAYDGLDQAPLTNWTVASLVAQTSGVPLNVYTDRNNYGTDGVFLPGITNLGDILSSNGYRNIFLMGSEASFAGRDIYYKTHGNYEIMDYDYMVEKNVIPSDYYEFWGYEDLKLFSQAKKIVDDLANSDQPFNLKILTVDSHFPDGYMDDSCSEPFDSEYANSIYCSDQKIGEFIEWFSNHPLYEDTTIVITGDHYTMNYSFASNYNKEEQGIVNIIINSEKEIDSKFNKQATVLDIFPTILSSLNVEIEGDRLGLGTDLFSDKLTLVEYLGSEYFYDHISRKSDYYNDEFMK